MTLLALLILYPTPLVTTSGLVATSPGAYTRAGAAGPVLHDQRSVSSSADPAGGDVFPASEADDDQRDRSVLGDPALPRLCRRDDAPSRPRSWPLRFPSSVRPRHLRC